MIRTLRIVCLMVSLFMIFLVVKTSMESNLIKEWHTLGQIPWMRTTLWDFYFNIALLSGWMFYKESRWSLRGLWLAAFVGLGSIATLFYVYRKLSQLQPGDSWGRFWLKEQGRGDTGSDSPRRQSEFLH